MKKVKILIIILTMVLVLGGATFATLYFATDLLKSDKEMFYKYISQMDLKETVNSNENIDYQERLRTENNTNEGNISIKINAQNEEFINESFDFTTQSKPSDNFASAKIDIKQNDEKKLTIDYLKNEDLYGLKFEDIVKQYVVLENNNLKEFAQKLGIENIDSIPNKLEMQVEETTNEEVQSELEQIITKYVNTAIEKIPNESYSKIKKENITLEDKEINADGYQLNISSDILKEILLKTLNLMKEYTEIYDLLNEISEEEIELEVYTETMQSLIDDIQEEDSKINMCIKVYKQNKETVKILGIVKSDEENGKIEFSIEKLQDKYSFLVGVTSDDEKTNIIFKLYKSINNIDRENLSLSILVNENDEELANISIEALRIGRLDSASIETNLKFDMNFIEEDLNLNATFTNIKEFGKTIETKEFQENDYAIINQFDAQQISNITTNIITMIYEKLDKEKTVFGVISEMMNTNNLYNIARDNAQYSEYLQQQENEFSSQLNNQAIEMFNMKFTSYEGVQRGSAVKTLVSTIDLNNTTNLENKVECNKTITDIDSSKNYIVSFGKDSEGYINKAIIEEQ